MRPEKRKRRFTVTLAELINILQYLSFIHCPDVDDEEGEAPRTGLKLLMNLGPAPDSYFYKIVCHRDKYCDNS